LADLTVRRATVEDAPAIAAIWNAVIVHTTITFTTELKDADEIADRAHEFRVAEKNGAVVGFACLVPFRSGPGYADVREHSIHVDASARGAGVGRALMTALEADARAAGLRVLMAGISGENPGAVIFHARLGFEQVGRLPGVGVKFGRRLDLVLMQKNLVPPP
jgi:phosphinothricin acetyltransferase